MILEARRSSGRDQPANSIMLREAFMLVRRGWMIVTLLLTAPIPAAAGNVITEWNEKAVGNRHGDVRR